MPTLIQATEIEKDIYYYITRLNEIKRLYLNHETDILNKNKDKIQRLVDEYETKFKNTKQYDWRLSESIKTFIL